jgi:cell division protein FtsB
LTHPDRAVKVKELENLKGEREQLKKEIERLTTNYG